MLSVQNVTLITSVINIPNNITGFSYSQIRSVFSREDRFIQTQQTIKSVKEKIPNNFIFLIECSELNEEEINYFKNNTDLFINLYDNIKDIDTINKIFSVSKSMGEGTMTIKAIEILVNLNIDFKNLFKLSGRYWLNDNFNFNNYDNNEMCVFIVDDNEPNSIINNLPNSTCFYKLSTSEILDWYVFLNNSNNDFYNCLGYEEIFTKFVKKNNNKKIMNKPIGINGYVSVCGTFYEV